MLPNDTEEIKQQTSNTDIDVDDDLDNGDFEFDEDGNIVIPDFDEDTEDSEDDSDDSADEDEDAEDSEDDDSAQSQDDDQGTAETAQSQKETDAQPENKPTVDDKDQLLAQSQREKKALERQVADTLAKMGIKSSNLMEGLEQLAADAENLSLDQYRENKRKSDDMERAQEIIRQQRFQAKMQADLKAVQEIDPETKSLTSITQIANFAMFARLRDAGFSPAEAYSLANKDKAVQKAVDAAKQQARNDNKAHLKPTSGKSTSKGNTVTMTRKELQEWREMFPDKTDAEILKLYKKTI